MKNLDVGKLLAREERQREYRRQYYREKYFKKTMVNRGTDFIPVDIGAAQVSRAILQVGKICKTPWLDGVNIDARLLDARIHYNKIQFLVEPLAGDGSRWVRSIQPLPDGHMHREMSVDIAI